MRNQDLKALVAEFNEARAEVKRLWQVSQDSALDKRIAVRHGGDTGAAEAAHSEDCSAWYKARVKAREVFAAILANIGIEPGVSNDVGTDI